MLRRLRNHGRSIGWSAFVLVLALVALALWRWLPPEPRVLLPAHERDRLEWLSPDGGKLLVCERFPDSRHFRLWDARDGTEIGTILTGSEVREQDLTVSPDGRILAATEKHGTALRFVDLHTRREWMTVLPDTVLERSYLQFSPNSDLIAVSDHHGVCFMVEAATGRILDRFTTSSRGPVFFTGQGDYFVLPVLKMKKWQPGLWNTKTHRIEAVLNTDGEMMTHSPDGRTLIAGHRRGGPNGFERWDRLTLWDVDPAATKPRAALNAKSFDDHHIQFSVDSRMLVTWCSAELDVHVLEFWDVKTGNLLAQSRPTRGACVGEFSPDGTRYALFCTPLEHPTPSALKFHDVRTGRILWENPWSPDGRGASDTPQFSPGGSVLVAYSSSPNRLECLETATGVARTMVRTPDVLCENELVATPDKRFLAYREKAGVPMEATLADKALEWLGIRKVPQGHHPWDLVSVFDSETGREIFHLERTETVMRPMSPLLSDDGKTVVTLHADYIAIWDVPTRPALRWVLGVPLGLGVAGWCAMWLWRRRRTRSSKASG